jgi:glyoxylase-like metal-dependent hydrolase (beta-lactamase superfamily II)
MKKLLALLLTLALLAGLVTVAAAEADMTPASSTYGWVVTPGSKDDANYVTVEILEAKTSERKVYTSAYPLDSVSSLTKTLRADALVATLNISYFIEVIFNAAGEVIDFEVVEQNVGRGLSSAAPFNYYMDSAKYGGELTAPGGGAGRMVAQGWVLGMDKDARTITVGDGNHLTNVFEETYTIADDAEIYLVDNSYTVEGTGINASWNTTEASLNDVKVCPVSSSGKAPGEIYYERVKYNVLAIFDGDYTTYGEAKVNELYIFRNPLILASNQLSTPDDVAYTGDSWYPAYPASEEYHQYGFDGSCTPFEVLKNRLYSVGDCYTMIYLLIGDDGSMTLIDEGNRCATYQYWLNIEKMGYDPREVDNILLTHGHGDHYQALYENVVMNNHYHISKGDLKAGEQYLKVQTSTQNESGYGYLGYPELTPELSDNSIRYCLTEWDVWYEWKDFGGGIELMPFLTVGHSKDTASFALKVTAREGDEVFEPGKVVGFIYMGGYGAQNNLNVGYRRLAYVDGLKYLQSVIGPMVAEQVDYIYNLPQHSNQYPWYEVSKAARTAGVPVMSVMTEGLDGIQNFCEKRISYNTYERFYQSWKNKTDYFGNLLEAAANMRCNISSRTLQTIEAYGPYKRAAGEYELTVESALILHGFNAWQNPNEAFAGQWSVYGFELNQGIVIHKDSFVHEPNAYFVQIVCHVNDDYAGKVDYDTNWNNGNYAGQWTSGPVEIANRPDADNFTEIVRTTRVDSLEAAEALLASIEAGKTYKVQMDIISDIIVADNLAETFVPVN